MSYVIQNFSYNTKLIVTTPRFRFLILLKLIPKILFFFKLNYHLISFSNPQFNPQPYFFLFSKYFFLKYPSRSLLSMNLELSGYYLNNLSKSSLFWFFCSLTSYFYTLKAPTSLVNVEGLYNFNLRFLAIKTANNRINKKLYENAFFYLMLQITHLWFVPHNLFYFYLNFFITPYNLQMLKFFNGYFFKIYNF